MLTSLGAGAATRHRATVRTPPPPWRAAAAAASAAARKPGSLRSLVWAKPVVSPTTTRMPAPRSRPDARSSTRPSSSRAADPRRSSANTSANSPPVRNATPRTPSTTDSSITCAPVCIGTNGGYPRTVGFVPVTVGVCGQTELGRHGSGHGRRAGHRRRARAGDAPAAAAVRAGRADRGVGPNLEPGQTTVGFRVEFTHLTPRPGGQHGGGDGHPGAV